MSKIDFNWEPFENSDSSNHSLSDKKDETTAQKISQHFSLKLNRNLIFYGILGLALLGLAVHSSKKEPTPKKSPTSTATIESLAPVTPIRKGKFIEFSQLRKVKVRVDSLTKTQYHQIVRNDDWNPRVNRLRAKADLPPHRPLLWPKLELAPMPSTSIKPKRAPVLFIDKIAKDNSSTDKESP